MVITSIREYVDISLSELAITLKKHKNRPVLGLIRFGEDPAANSYIKGLIKDCETVGFEYRILDVKSVISYSDIYKFVVGADGIVFVKPWPENVSDDILNFMEDFRDINVDGTAYNTYPATPAGIVNYLQYLNYPFEGRDVCIVGRSSTVGKPLADMLLKRNCTVTIAHSKSNNLKSAFTFQDLIILATDKVEYFDKSYFYPYQMVIDVGIGTNSEGKLKGNLTDDAIQYIKDNCGCAISGTGGIGLLTRLQLLKNTYELYLAKNRSI